MALVGLLGLAAIAQSTAFAQDCGQQPTCTQPLAQIRITNDGDTPVIFHVDGLNGLQQVRDVAAGGHEVVGFAVPGTTVDVALNNVATGAMEDYMQAQVPANATTSTYIEFTADSTPEGQWGMSVSTGTDVTAPNP